MAHLSPLDAAFESYDLPDCAAEIFVKYREQLSPLVDVGACLDLLTTTGGLPGLSYTQHMERFKENPRSFLPNHAPPPEPESGVAGRAKTLLRRIRRLVLVPKTSA